VASRPSGDIPDDGLRPDQPIRPYLARTEVIPRVGAVLTNRTDRCPECGLTMPAAEVPAHLIARHTYVDVFGILLPLPAALASLWDRVFARGDVHANKRLCQILKPAPGQATDPPPYVAALEAELVRRGETLFASRYQELPRLINCLCQSDAARPYFRHLLQSGNARVREVGRELLLAEAGAILAGNAVTAGEVRAWLDRLCPSDDVWDKIRLGQRLARFGVNEAALKACLRQLREERPVACPECGAAVAQGQLETHLRQIHHIYQVHGARLSVDEAVTALLDAVCAPTPDTLAWETLELLARDEYSSRAEEFLATRLVRTLQDQGRERRERVLPAVVETLTTHDRASALAGALAAIAASVAHHLALALTPHLTTPLPRDLVIVLQPLLGSKRVPEDVRLAAASALLRTTGTEGRPARAVLRALTARSGKARAVDRLRHLEQLTGKAAAIDELCTRLEEKIRLRCPRCDTQARRKEMIQHLWTAHGLLLYGRRVREPWQLVEDLILEYQARGDAQLLERCRTLGEFLDHARGLERVYRLFLAKGLHDVEAREALLNQARQGRGSLCPHCFAFVPVLADAAPRQLDQAHGRLWGHGYGAGVSETGYVPRLDVYSPSNMLARGREPGQWCTCPTTLWLLAGPPVLVALALAWVVPPPDPALPRPGLGLLLAALVAGLGVQIWCWQRRKPLERAIDHAWRLLPPQLHTAGFARPDAEFLADLALSSIGRGRPEVRAEALERMLKVTEKATADNACPVALLAALRRLVIEDAVVLGDDPIVLVAAQVGRCFEAELPLVFAEHLLADWESDWWTTANLTRLRVLLSDRAFEAGLEVRDLREASRTAPALGGVLLTADEDELARLRLLWSLRPRRPWGRWSDASTVFEQAADPDPSHNLLGQYPDLLLADLELPAVLLCGGGLVFQGTLFTAPPRVLEVKARRNFEGVDFELVLGDLRLRFATDPTPLVKRLEYWFRYHFGDFLPQVDTVYDWQAPGQARKMRLREAVRCPECRRQVLARVGAVGRAVDDAGAKGGG
jgi:hypothetical protein